MAEPSSLSSSALWRGNKAGGWFAVASISFIFLWQLSFKFIFPVLRSFFASVKPSSPPPVYPSSDASDGDSLSPFRISELVSESDLKFLVENLEEKAYETEKWENVIEKSRSSVFYKAKCCKPKDGPLRYLSTTVFENCSPEVVRDFYMDSDFRKQWDKTIAAHEQLQVDRRTGVEIGRTIKKFPLLTPREYVSAWKLWEGSNSTFYCFTKECEHPLTPRQKKYVRVSFFRSGWRIRQVPGRNACEIKLVHQEDAGMNVEVAKFSFAKGIWSYVCKMDDALRKYASIRNRQPSLEMSAVSLMQKVPPELDAISTAGTSDVVTASSCAIRGQEGGVANLQKINRKPTKKMITNGLLLLGSLICLSHGNSGLGAKVTVAFVLKKLCKRGPSAGQNVQM